MKNSSDNTCFSLLFKNRLVKNVMPLFKLGSPSDPNQMKPYLQNDRVHFKMLIHFVYMHKRRAFPFGAITKTDEQIM